MDHSAALRTLHLALLLQLLPALICSAASCVGKGEDVRCVVDQSAYNNNDVSTGIGSASRDAVKQSSGHSDLQHHWGYDNDNGPSFWPLAFPECGGRWQSPVALDTTLAETQHHPRLHWFGWHNLPVHQVLATNGHTVSLTSTYETEKDVPLVWLSESEQRYKLSSVHFHWGSSEHTLNGERFSMEMHVVTFDRRYPSVPKAFYQKNGLMVLGYFFRESQHANEALDLVLGSHLAAVKRANSSVMVAQPQRLSRLVRPFEKAFLLYQGSLTTPPCRQVVRWILSKDVLSVSHQQVGQFKKLENEKGKPLEHNWRPLQPLNRRTITQIL